MRLKELREERHLCPNVIVFLLYAINLKLSTVSKKFSFVNF